MKYIRDKDISKFELLENMEEILKLQDDIIFRRENFGNRR